MFQKLLTSGECRGSGAGGWLGGMEGLVGILKCHPERSVACGGLRAEMVWEQEGPEAVGVPANCRDTECTVFLKSSSIGHIPFQ